MRSRQPSHAISPHDATSGARALPRRLIWGNLLLLGSLTVGLVVLELALGFTHYRYLTHPRIDYPANYFRNDPDLGADVAPNQPRATVRMRGPSFVTFTNALDCFDHDGPIGNGYVLALGDSSTWGYAALEDKWTSHLETLSGRRVLKCGVSGTGPRHQRLKAAKTIAKVGRSPAIILVLYDTWNDLNDDMVFPGYGVVDGYRGHTLKSLDLRTGLVTRYTPEAFDEKYRRYLGDRARFSLTRALTENLTTAAIIGHVLAEEPARDAATVHGPILERRYDVSLWKVDPARYAWINQAFEEHVANLRGLRELAEAHRAALVLITNGMPDSGLHARLQAFLADEMPYHVDLAGPIARAAQGERVTYHHDDHWNALGNRLAAEALHAYLKNVGLLQP
jgi:hypothetical protein